MNTRLRFHAWLRDEHYSVRTAQLYYQYVTRASREMSLARATSDQLRDWWSTLPHSASSRNGARHALIAWYRYRGRPDGRPAHQLPRIPAPDGLPRPVPADVFDQLRRTAHSLGGPHAAIGALLGDTGCRIGEASRARWSQFHLGNDPIWRIEGKGSRRRGPKERVVPLNGHIVAALVAWRSESDSADWLFPSDRSFSGHAVRCTLARWVADICAAANVEYVTPHRWRHSVATIGLERTGQIREIQHLLGHASLATTQVYTQVSPVRLRAVVNALVAPDLGGFDEAA